MIPEFRDDGYLPEGIHIASEFDVLARFGEVSTQRKRLCKILKNDSETCKVPIPLDQKDLQKLEYIS